MRVGQIRNDQRDGKAEVRDQRLREIVWLEAKLFHDAQHVSPRRRRDRPFAGENMRNRGLADLGGLRDRGDRRAGFDGAVQQAVPPPDRTWRFANDSLAKRFVQATTAGGSRRAGPAGGNLNGRFRFALKAPNPFAQPAFGVGNEQGRRARCLSWSVRCLAPSRAWSRESIAPNRSMSRTSPLST